MHDGPVTCPFCRSLETEPMALFGQQLLTVQYYCNGCKTPFEKVRDERVLSDFHSVDGLNDSQPAGNEKQSFVDGAEAPTE